MFALWDQDDLADMAPQPHLFVIAHATAQGEGSGIGQQLIRSGLVKAGAHVDGTGTAAITYSFNLIPGNTHPGQSTPALTDLGTGMYEIDFGLDVRGRYYMATLGKTFSAAVTDGVIKVTPRAGNVDALYVECRDTVGALVDNEFFLMIY